MPQREFWTQRHAVAWAAGVTLDPTDPGRPSLLAFEVLDQSRRPMESATMSVPANVLHEAVSGLLHDCWDAWLFGEPGSVTRTLKDVGGEWRKEARHRPIW